MGNVKSLSTQDLRLLRRVVELLPIKDISSEEKEIINKVEFTKVITFITNKPIWREIAFQYIVHNNIVDFVKVFSAEDIKDIYFKQHSVFNSFSEIHWPIVVVLLGKELYNKQMVSIMNLFIDQYLRYTKAKSLIFVYEGTASGFSSLYNNAGERGILNSGKIITLTGGIDNKILSSGSDGSKTQGCSFTF